MHDKIRHIYKKISPVLSAVICFKELILILVYILSFFTQPLNTELVVTYQEEGLLFADLFEPSKRKEGEKIEIKKSGTKLVTVEFKSKSKNNIENIEFTLNGVDFIQQLTVYTSSHRLELNRADLMKYSTIENSRLYFHNFRELAPEHVVKYQFVGDFYHLLFQERINVSSNAKNSDISKKVFVTGVNATIGKYFSLLIAVLIMLSIIAGAKRIKGVYSKV